MESYPYTQPPAPKKTNTVLIIVLVVLGLLLLCCLGFGGFAFYAFKKTKGFIGCMSRYPFLNQAAIEYAQNHNGKLPDGKNWQDEIAKYYIAKSGKNSSSIINFGDPKGDLGCEASSDSPATGVAYNSKLSDKNLDQVKSSGDNPVIFFEVSKTGRNLSEPYKSQPGKSPQKLMGSNRPWLWITIDGTMPNMQGGQTYEFKPGSQAGK